MGLHLRLERRDGSVSARVGIRRMMRKALALPWKLAKKVLLSRVAMAVVWAHALLNVAHAKKLAHARKRRLRTKWLGKMGARDLEKLMSKLPAWVSSGEVERVDFLNRWIESSWEGIGSVIDLALRELIQPLLQEMYFGEDIRFEDVDVGENPIVIEGVAVHDNHLVVDEKGSPLFSIDLDLLWDANCKAVLKIVQSKYLKFSAQIENVSFAGRLRLTFSPIVPTLPLIGGLHVAFVDMPHIDYTLALLDTIQVGSIPKLSNWLQALFKSECLYWMCHPFFLSFQFVEWDYGLQSSASIREALGILSVRVRRGELQAFQSTWGSSSPAFSIMLELMNAGAGFTAAAQTSCLQSFEPDWEETFHFLVDSRGQRLHIVLTSEERQKTASQVAWTSKLGRADAFMKIITPSLTMGEALVDFEELIDGQNKDDASMEGERQSMWLNLSKTANWALTEKNEQLVDGLPVKVAGTAVSLAQRPFLQVVKATSRMAKQIQSLAEFGDRGRPIQRRVHVEMSYTPLLSMDTVREEKKLAPFGALFVRILHVSGFSKSLTGRHYIIASIPGQTIHKTRSVGKRARSTRVNWNQECRFVLDQVGFQESIRFELHRKPLVRQSLAGSASLTLAPLLDRLHFSRVEELPLSSLPGEEALTLHVGFFWRQAVRSEPVFPRSAPGESPSMEILPVSSGATKVAESKPSHT